MRAPDLLTVAEVAEVLRVNDRTVRRWIDEGRLTSRRIGKASIRISRRDLDRFLADSRRREPERETETTEAILTTSA